MKLHMDALDVLGNYIELTVRKTRGYQAAIEMGVGREPPQDIRYGPYAPAGRSLGEDARGRG